MSLQVRAVAPDEFEPWIAAMHVAFHSTFSAADEAAFRREAYEQPCDRALATFDGETIIGTFQSFPTALTLPGGACVASDAISAVSVLPSHRRRGALTRMITQDLRDARDRGELAAILMPSEYPIYGRFGFGHATVRVEYTVDAARARFTQSATGQVSYVEPKQLRELALPIFEQFRRSHPGQIEREPVRWDTRLGLRKTPWNPNNVVRSAIHTSERGDIDGYLFYRTDEMREQRRPGSRLELNELISLTDDAYISLWRFCCEMDLIGEIRAGMRSPDEPLPWLLDNPRAAITETRRGDLLWLRPLDVPRFLSARTYAAPGSVVIEVVDPLELSGGRFALEGGPEGAACHETTKEADLALGISALGAISLGGHNLRVLAGARLIEERAPGAIELANNMFRSSIAPWCSTFF